MLSLWLSQNFNVPSLLNIPSGSYVNLVSSVLRELMHIVSLAGCATGAGVGGTVLLPWTSGGLCVQKSAGDVIQVLVHWI